MINAAELPIHIDALKALLLARDERIQGLEAPFGKALLSNQVGTTTHHHAEIT